MRDFRFLCVCARARLERREETSSHYTVWCNEMTSPPDYELSRSREYISQLGFLLFEQTVGAATREVKVKRFYAVCGAQLKIPGVCPMVCTEAISVLV